MSSPADAPGITSFTPDQLVRVARLFASDDSLAAHLEDLPQHGSRRRISLAQAPHLEMWAISWPVGSASDWHDHGKADGAFVVVRGTLLEETWTGAGIASQLYSAGEERSFGPGLIHRTSAFGDEPALSVHAYTPKLDGVRSFNVVDNELVETQAEASAP